MNGDRQHWFISTVSHLSRWANYIYIQELPHALPHKRMWGNRKQGRSFSWRGAMKSERSISTRLLLHFIRSLIDWQSKQTFDVRTTVAFAMRRRRSKFFLWARCPSDILQRKTSQSIPCEWKLVQGNIKRSSLWHWCSGGRGNCAKREIYIHHRWGIYSVNTKRG